MALTTAQLHNAGVGLHVKDTLAAALRASSEAAITSATTTTGSWVEVGYPMDVAVELQTGTITGTSVTVDVEIQGADDSSATNLVSLGRFAQFDETADGETRYLDMQVLKRYMRAVIVTAGTTPSVDPVILVRDADYKRQSNRTA